MTKLRTTEHPEVSADGEELGRVNARVTRRTLDKMTRLVPWGLRRATLETVLTLVLDAVEKDGMPVLGAILDGKYKLTPTTTAMSWERKGKEDGPPERAAGAPE